MDLPLFPLNTVLFPGMTLPLHIFEPRYKQMINECIEREWPFGVVLIEEGPEIGGGARPHRVGVTARITAVERLEDGRMSIDTVGQDRFEILDTHERQPFLTGEVELLADLDAASGEAFRQAERVRERFLRFFQLTLALRGEWSKSLRTPANTSTLADHIAARLPVENEIKQRLLEELSVPLRLAEVARLLEPACEDAAARVITSYRRRFAGFGVLN